MTNYLQQMPPVITRSPRYVTWDIQYANDWTPDSSNPPTASYITFDGSSATYMPSWLFDNASTEYLYGLYIFPKEIYLPDGIEVFLGWIPAASWTSGDYYWTLESIYKSRNGDTTGGSVNTQLTINPTPSAANVINETSMGTLTPTTGDELMTFRLLMYDVETAADADVHAGWLRFQYTAWRAGTGMHPLTTP